MINLTTKHLDKISAYLGWTAKIANDEGKMIDNPVSKRKFVHKKIEEYLRSCYEAQKVKEAEVARQTAIDEAKTETSTLKVSE